MSKGTWLMSETWRSSEHGICIQLHLCDVQTRERHARNAEVHEAQRKPVH